MSATSEQVVRPAPTGNGGPWSGIRATIRGFAPWRKIGVDAGLALVWSVVATIAAWIALRLTPTTFGERWTTGGPDEVLHYVIFRSAQDVFPFFPNPGLGFPNAQNLFFAPLIDPGSAIYISIAAAITHNSILVLNSYLLLTFFGTTFTAFLFFRLFGMNRAFAAVLGLAFSLLPLHFMQLAIGHPFLANYWAVPLAGIMLLMIGGARTNPLEGWVRTAQGRRMRRARRWIPIVALALLVGLTQSYYYVFAAIVLGGVWLFRVIRTFLRRERLRTLGWPTATLVTLFLVIVIQLGTLSLNFGERYERYFSSRTAGESELYGGKIAALLLPWPGTGTPLVGSVSQKYFTLSSVVPTSEGPWSSILAVIAFVLVSFVIIVRLLGPLRPSASLVARELVSPRAALASTAFLWSLLFYVTGGLGVIFAVVVSPEIRAWSRISVVMSLLALAVLGGFLQSVVRRTRWRVVVLGLVSVLIVVDQLGGVVKSVPLMPSADTVLKSTASAMEKEFPAGCGIVELPLKAFPESGNVGTMGDYDHGLPYLYATTLKWSYGAVEGTKSGDYWNSATTPTAAVSKIRSSGACGIFVNLGAYADDPDGWKSTVAPFADPSSPTITSSDGNYLVFNIR